MKDYYEIEAVSNSSLSWFEQSPLYFKKLLNKEIEQEDHKYYERGTQIHMFLLEPDKFDKNYTHLDYDTPKTEQQKTFCKKVSDAKPKDQDAHIHIYKETYSSKNKSDDKIREEATSLISKYEPYIKYLKKSKQYKEVLNESTWTMLQSIKAEVLKHDAAAGLLGLIKDPLSEAEGHSEYKIEFKDINTDLNCKALIDRLIIDKKNKEITLIDIKSTSTFKDFKDKVREYRYDRQLAFYWRAIFHQFKDTIDEEYKFKTYIIAINTKELVEVKVFDIPEKILHEADDEINRLMLRLAWHYENDTWEHVREYYGNKGIEKL